MRYVSESPEDRRSHRRHHNKQTLRFPARPLKTDRIVWQEGNERITAVNFRSHRAQKARANLVSSVANRDTHFDFPTYDSTRFVHERRDIGNVQPPGAICVFYTVFDAYFRFSRII